MRSVSFVTSASAGQRTFRYRSAILMVCLTVAILLVAGCENSKNLTPARAKRLLEEKLREENRVTAVLDYSAIAALLGHKTAFDYQQDRFATSGGKPEVALHRLLETGLVTRTVGKDVYRNLTGSYLGDDCCANLTLTIAMQPGSPSIDGTYCCSNGHELHVAGSVNGGDGRIAMEIYHRAIGPTIYHIETKDGGILLVADTKDGSYPRWFCKTCIGDTFELATYEYSAAPKFLNDYVRTPGKVVAAGTFEIDSVNNLLLGETDTFAEGQFAYHVDYNTVGRAITGNAQTNGVGRAIFRKQPDGTWVCAEHH